MKVLLYAIFPTDGKTPKGGVETATYNLLCGFRNLDVTVRVVSFNKDLKEPKEIDFSENIKVLLFPYKFKRSTIQEILFHSKKVLKRLNDDFNPDIVHIQGNGSRLFARKVFKGKPVVATPHANLINEYKNITSIGERLNYKIMMHAEKANIQKLDGLIYIADYYKKHFEAQYQGLKFLNQKIFNAVHPDFYKDVEGEANETGLVYVGVINKRKNLLCLLRSLSSIKKEDIDFKLHIVGGYDDENYKSEVEGFVKQHELSSSIVFHGWKSQQEVKGILNENDIFVLTSKAEGLPISIGEAMAMGKVVISSDVGGIPEIIDNTENGYLFSVDDQEGLTAILREVLTSRNAEISAKARQSAFENHSPEKVAMKTLAFYKKVLN